LSAPRAPAWLWFALAVLAAGAASCLLYGDGPPPQAGQELAP
jgi:hypothetical protein